jgi:DNA polymerase-3 subunit alpha
MGKKDKKIMEELKSEFIDGAQRASKLSAKLAGEIFDLIEKFASYGFNKSHSVAYSVIAYQTAYLKAHYPQEYMAATLTSEINNTDKIVLFIDDCRKQNIQVLPPDVNESNKDFTVIKNGIRFGLAAIKNVGVNAVETIVKVRTEKGKFTSLFDFCKKVDLHTVNKKTIEGLVLSGAFDSITKNRAQLFKSVEQMITAAATAQEHEIRGQESLFGGDTRSSSVMHLEPQLPNLPMWTESEKLANEKAVLGFYVSGHPLLKYEREINAFASVHLGDVEGMKNGEVKAGGIITSIKKKIDKKGNTMAFITIEDFTGKAECVVFSSIYKKCEELIREESMILVKGKGEVNGEVIKIIADEIMAMDTVRERYAKKIYFLLNADDIPDGTLEKFRELLESSKGNCSCFFNVVGKAFARQQVFVSKKYSVNPTTEFIESAKEILGKNSIKFT